MCFHNSMSKKAQELAARYGRKSDIIEIVKEIIEEQYHVNAFNFPVYPIITEAPEVQALTWGLIPHWVSSSEEAKEIRSMTLNAKSETVFTKPSFRKSVFSRRCLVPSTGFFEWRHEGKNRIPYFIRLDEGEMFSMGGVFDRWVHPVTKASHSTFSILTTEANDMMAYIHNTKRRMPLIIAKEDEDKWLSSSLKEEEIKGLLLPYPSGKMTSYPVEDFTRKSPSDPGIIAPKQNRQNQLF